MRLSPVFMHDEQNDAQQNTEFICFCPKSSRRFIRLKYKTVNDSILFDDFSHGTLSIFRAVCPQKVAKSYQKRFVGMFILGFTDHEPVWV